MGSFLLVTVVMPALLVVLAVGAGLAVERATGQRLPGLLIPPLGLAALMVAGELSAWARPFPSATPVALVAVAAGGYALGWKRLRAARIDPWAVAAAAGAYLVVCLPVLAAGRVTLAGYLLDTTVGVHLTGAEALAEHGRDYSSLTPSSHRAYLENYLGVQYPTGGHALLLGLGRLSGQDLIWVYQPFLAALVAFCAPILSFLAASAGAGRRLAAVSGFVSAVPALVFSYAQMGAIKELAVLPPLLLLGAVLVSFPRQLGAGWRAVVPLAVTGGAGIAAIGVSFGPWLLPTALGCLVVAVFALREGRIELPAVGRQALGLAGLVVVLSLPTVAALSDSLTITKGLSASNAVAAADPGNLLQPLHETQMLGIWLHGTHRLNPQRFLFETHLLIAVAALSALLGGLFLLRRRAWTLLGFVGISAIVWFALTRYGKTWTDAKLLVLASPVAVLMAMIGAASLARGRWRVLGGALLAAMTAGVLLSNALVYHDTNLAPTDRYKELVSIGERFAGQGPTLTPDFDEFALYALRNLDPDLPGGAFKSRAARRLRGGRRPEYGHSYDLDALPIGSVRHYPMIVVRRSPEQSRPPSGYRRAFAGRWYEVWRRAEPVTVLAHVPAGRDGSAQGRPACGQVRSARAAIAAKGDVLTHVRTPSSTRIRPERAARSPNWGEVPGGIRLSGAGELSAPVTLPAGGDHLIWLKGDFTRRVEVLVDGRPVGSVAYESGGNGNYAEPIAAHLRRGQHRLGLRRGGGTLRPGDGGYSRLLAIVVERRGEPVMHATRPRRWRALCSARVDWVEAVTR